MIRAEECKDEIKLGTRMVLHRMWSVLRGCTGWEQVCKKIMVATG